MGMLPRRPEKKSYTTFSVNRKYFPTYDEFYRFMNNKPKPKVKDFYVNDKLVHGGTRLPIVFAYLLGSEPFKRIFNIYQLSEKHLLVEGATHKRGEHCIGVGITIGKILNNSKNENKELTSSLDDRAILNYVAAAMIHDDLGHLPQGHVHAERLEEMGIGFKEKETSIIKLKKMEGLLERQGFDVDKIMSIIKGEDNLSFLLDDPLDGDKLDYFVRDGNACNIINFASTPLAICNSILNNLLVDGEGWYVKGPVPMKAIIRDFHSLRIALYDGFYWNDLNGRNADVMIRHVCGKYAKTLQKNKNNEEIIAHLSQLDDIKMYEKMRKMLPDDRTLKKLVYAHDLSPEKARELMWKPAYVKRGKDASDIITDHGLERSFEVTDKDGNIIAVDLKKPKPLKKKPARIAIKGEKMEEITSEDLERLFMQPSTGLTVFSENPYLDGEEAFKKAIDLFYR